MQTPSTSTPIDTLKKVAWYHDAALQLDERTVPLRAAFTAALGTWEAALADVDARTRALTAPRVRVRFAEVALEDAIEALFLDASKAEHESVLRRVFPDGKLAETKPRGVNQLKRTKEKLLPRVRELAADHALRTTHLAGLDARVAELDAAIEARRTGADQLAAAATHEQLAREDLCTAFKADAGAIQHLYPSNAAKRDRFFDEFRARATSEDDGGGADPVAPTPL